MSIFNELLPKISEITNAFIKNFNDDLEAAYECIDKFEEEFQNGRGKARDKTQKDKNHMTTLQSIHEDEDEPTKTSDTDSKRSSNKPNSRSSAESNSEKPRSNKRSKHEVDGLSSPEQDKRQKRNASVRAQSIISKQVNVNLTQKMRREDTDKKSTSRRRKEDDKENAEPLLNVEIKQEKISLPPEPMDMESLPTNIEVKQEATKDEIAMPPPMAPVPRPRTKVVKEKPVDETSEDESSSKRRSTRTRKQTDNAPPVADTRSTRASSRSTKQSEAEDPTAVPEPRPKRTRAKKKISEPPAPEPEKEPTDTPTENNIASPAEKPRPKRTRRAQKAGETEPKPETNKQTEPIVSPKEERISQPEVSSPIISQPTKEKKHIDKGKIDLISETLGSTIDSIEQPKESKNMEKEKKHMEKAKIDLISETIGSSIDGDAMDKTRVLANDMDKTVVLPNGVYNHAPVTPKAVRAMNETVVIEACTRETIVLSKPQNVMDATVVLDKEPMPENVTDDNSLLTDDSDSQEAYTPPKQEPPKVQTTSAVKEKVQQFEELASRVTRTKTRAMAKKEEETETHTPPDKIVKPVISVETLNKMNNMIFNGKQISSSASKPRSNIPTSKPVCASASKVSSINKAREEAEAKREKEDARKKKEAMLEAKREAHKRKREEKMAAAAAARSLAEMSRRANMQAAAREREEKQAHADLSKRDRLKEAERKKQELARKVAETEERRRAEEQARQQRLADEQRKADEARRKQLEEAAAVKKEAALMAKEIEKRQKEYNEKQKLKQSMKEKNQTPLKGQGSALEPAYMADGFQYLNSDEDEEPVERPVPEWSTSKARKQQLYIQSQIGSAHIDCLFSVRVHSPDLRDIFPSIERARLKRTSSAVWRTPPAPARLPALAE